MACYAMERCPPRHMLHRQRDSVFCDDRLARRRVRRDKDGVAHLEMVDGLFLECVELEGVLRDSDGIQQRRDLCEERKLTL